MKTVVITGTSRGLGLELARHFSSRGWQVIGMGRNNPHLTNYAHYTVDIADRTQVQEAAASIRRMFGTVNVLINNAAAFDNNDFDTTDISNIDRVIDVNVKGTMYTTHCLLPLMTEGSKIIFVNSVAGVRDIQHQSIYCASKSALRSFAGVIGQELRDRRIKVSSIHPGGINTTLWNEHNPYPCGVAKDALDPQAVVDMISFIAQDQSNAEYKTITMFPEVEWH
jgi:NADP-dependent 3-hydroxy acid dehydrogenase YdfG